MDLSKDTNEHYKVVHTAYHTAWFYGKDSPYEQWQLAKTENSFRGDDASPITEHTALVDVGGGTEGGCRESPGEGPGVGDSADSESCWGFPEQSYK